MTPIHDEVVNLADSPEHRSNVDRMRKALAEWEHRIKDVGFLSEWEMHDRSQGTTPYELGHDAQKYDFDAVYAAACLASSLQPTDVPKLKALLTNNDSAVRIGEQSACWPMATKV